MIKNLSDKELVHHVDNKPSATELERELANRLDAHLRPRCQHGELLSDYCDACDEGTSDGERLLPKNLYAGLRVTLPKMQP